MAGLGDIVQKAFYLGVGLATTASEQAGEKLSSLGVQAQKLADEMVAKGELSTEEARKLVDDLVKSAQQQNLNQGSTNTTERVQKNAEPRRIEIVADNEAPEHVNDMRKQVEALQEELKRMKNS